MSPVAHVEPEARACSALAVMIGNLEPGSWGPMLHVLHTIDTRLRAATYNGEDLG
jgi:hypothetical protein